MDLNITNFTPSFPVGNSMELFNNRHTNNQPNTDTGKTDFSNDAAMVSLSPEALKNGQSEVNAGSSKSGFLKTAQSKDDLKLNEAEKQLVRKLQLTDLHVKMHEQQHLAAAGSYARGGPSFQYVTGPDGKSYTVGGQVTLDVSPVANNPQATIVKAQVLKRAALAPSDPSGADQAIAAAATQMEAQARAELMNEKTKKTGILSEINGIKTGNSCHYYIKAYRNSLQCYRIGDYFNKIA